MYHECSPKRSNITVTNIYIDLNVVLLNLITWSTHGLQSETLTEYVTLIDSDQWKIGSYPWSDLTDNKATVVHDLFMLLERYIQV